MPDNLPTPRTTFVGRTEELRSLDEMVGKSGLFTLTGAGGSGKTRLMLEFAQRLVNRMPDGVWWVDLAPVVAQGGVARAVAAPVHIGQQAESSVLIDLLIDHFRRGFTAILLDNCEHVIDAVGDLVDQFTANCPNLLVLATSREPLRIEGEHVYVVPPLRVDDDAVALFAERARAVKADLVLGEDDRREVRAICERLDGMPLAIELAAPWVRMMSLPELHERLADRFALLIGTTRGVAERQRTLRATVDWSHDRLRTDERTLFRRLAVFSGSFSLSAAEQICSGEDVPPESVLKVLSRLCDQSMVVAQPDGTGGTRYRLLETLREYALERLRDADEEDRCRRRHFDHFLNRAEAADDRLRKTGSDLALMELVPDLDNLQSALRWSIDAHPNGALALAGALDQLWVVTVAAEGRRWLEEALARATSPNKFRARALTAIALPATDTSFEPARHRTEESLRIFTELGDATGQAWSLHIMGAAAWLHGELAIARDYLSQALSRHERLATSFAIERTLHLLGCTLINVPGGLEEGRAHLARACEVSRELNDRWAEQYTLAELAYAAMDLGDLESARVHLREALACGNRGVIVSVPLAGVARLVADEEPARAVSLLAAARTLNERIAGRSVFHLAFCNHQRAADTLNMVQNAMDPERFRRAWDLGCSFSTDEAIAFAVETQEGRKAPRHPGGLTAREVEIARLVAGGLGNKEIARTLYLSVRTVEAHLDHIFAKLQLNSRMKLTNWAREVDLAGTPSSKSAPTSP